MKLTKDDLGINQDDWNCYTIGYSNKKKRMEQITSQILRNQEDADLCEKLTKILMNHCGETGENEGAVETLERIIEDAEINTRILVQAQNDAVIVERLKRRTEEIESDKISYYEYRHLNALRELQKILGDGQ